jgi:cathepsin B
MSSPVRTLLSPLEATPVAVAAAAPAFPRPTTPAAAHFTYSVPAVSGDTPTTRLFAVPPLTMTQLISTPELTGVADVVSLTVMPVNKSLCSTVPTIAPPESFDFRQEFAEYTAPIINQGTCGSCWAIAATQSLTSRFALFRNQKALPLSAAYMLYCSRDTFSTEKDATGCSGGSLVDAFWFFDLNGTVSAECLKYDALGDWDPTNQTSVNLRERAIDLGAGASTPSVVQCPLRSCPGLGPASSSFYDVTLTTVHPPSRGAFGRATTNDRDAEHDVQPWVFRTAISYIVAGTARQSGGSEANIRQEIWRKGPVATGFQVCQDFVAYWKGLLERTLTGTARIYVPGPPDDEENAVMGNHAVQLVGWGQEGSVPYWIIANSWGASNTATDESGLQDYGNNGYFMMIRGTNAGALESNVVTGVPRVHPNVIGAAGRSAAEQSEEMCALIGYEINYESLAALEGGKFVLLPDVHTKYETTLPPLLANSVATVNAFATCPADRPVRCKYTDLCVTVPYECGARLPTQGVVRHSSIVNTELAGARELKGKYVAQQQLLRSLRRGAPPERPALRSASPLPAPRTLDDDDDDDDTAATTTVVRRDGDGDGVPAIASATIVLVVLLGVLVLVWCFLVVARRRARRG